jgi:hypothetical protein
MNRKAFTQLTTMDNGVFSDELSRYDDVPGAGVGRAG